MNIFAETKRLVLREILPSDAAGLFELDSDPEVHRYLGNKPVKDKAKIIEIIEFIRQQYADNGIGRWAVVDKVTGDFMGWSGIKLETNTTNGHQNYYDLGYRLIRRYWGQGIATESAIASLDYGFQKLHIKEVHGAASCENAASNKILLKTGLRFVESFQFEGIACNWYKMERADYLKLRSLSASGPDPQKKRNKN
jgi:RimJ/RimL family protein N-acetyltransferase